MLESNTLETPTNPSEVSQNTKLSNLNLNWSESELPQKKRTRHVHGLHPYLGKYIPQLVEIFLRKYFTTSQYVYDPFCGSGTTLIQANELGINSVGCDISAFNILLCHVKSDMYEYSILRNEVTDILNRTQIALENRNEKQLSLWETQESKCNDIGTEDPYLIKWYAPQSLKGLLTYHRYIEEGNYKYKNVLKIILTRAARSARLTTHYDLDFPKEPQTEPYWCYKHSRTCTPVQEAFKFLKRYSLDTLSRLRDYSLIQTDASVTLFNDDSRYVQLPVMDGVITSPPYVGLIDYHVQHEYAYHLLNLEDKREKEIGPGVAGKSKKAKKAYQNDIAETFRHTLKYLRPGGRLIVVAGDRHELYGQIAKMIEVDVEDIVTRHVNRRTGRRSTEFYESVFIWRKKG